MKPTTIETPLRIPPAFWQRWFDWPTPLGLQRLLRRPEFGPAIIRIGGDRLVHAERFWSIVEGLSDLQKRMTDAQRRDYWKANQRPTPEVVAARLRGGRHE